MASYDGTLTFDTKVDSSGFSSGVSAIGSIAKTGISATTAIIGAATTGIIAFGTASVKAGAEFDTAMSQLAATMGTTVDEIDELREKAKEMGSTTSFSATEAAEGLNILAMAGYNATEQIDMIGSVLNLAAAGATSMDSAASYLTTTLKGYCIQSEDVGAMTEYYSDLLAKGATLVNTSVDELGEALSTISATSNAYGQSVETTTTALLALADGGITGGQAATYLNRMMSNLYAPTNSAKSALDELGVSCYDEAGSARDLMDIINDLGTATANMTEEQSNAYLSTIMGTVGLKGYNVIANKSAEEIDALTASLTDCEGAAQAMADTQLDNLNGDITIMKSALEGLEISISDQVTPALREFVQLGTDQLGILTNAINENGLAGGISAIGEVLANIVTAITDAAPSVIDAASGLISGFCETIRDSSQVAESIGPVLESLIGAILDCAGEIWSTAMVLVTQLAQGLIDGIPTLLSKAQEMLEMLVSTFTDYLPEFTQAAVEIVTELALGLADGLPDLVSMATELLMSIVNTIIEQLPALIDAGVQVVNSLIEGLGEMIPDLLQAAIDLLLTIVDAIPTLIDSLIENLPSIITTIITSLSGAAPDILNAAINLLMGLVQAIPSVAVSVATAFPQIITAIITGITDAAPDVFASAKELLWNIITSIPDIVAGLAETVPDIITGIVQGLLNGVSAVKDAAVELGKGILGGIKSFFGINSPSTLMQEQGDYLVEGMINGLDALPGDTEELLSQTANNITVWGNDVMQSAMETGTNFLNSITDNFSQVPGAVQTQITTALTNITTWGSNVTASAQDTCSKMLTNVKDSFSQISSQIKTQLDSAFSNVSSWGNSMVSQFGSMGKNVMQGLINGMDSMVAPLYNSIKSSLSGLVDRAKQSLGIGSPSKVFAEEVGEWIPPGIGEGVEEEMPALNEQMQDDLDDMVGKMKVSVDTEMDSQFKGQTATAQRRAETEGQTEINEDNRFEQTNNYYVPVATPSETSKAQRDAARKMLGGVK